VRFRKDRHPHGVELSIAPLIDIVFLLIIFFMTVQEFSRLEVEDVNLTPAEEAQVEVEPPPQRVVINIRADGSLIVANQRLGLAAVIGLLERERDRLKRLKREHDLNVIVRADGGVPYERVQELMAEAARLNIWRITFAAMTEEERAP